VGEYSMWLEYHYESIRMMKDLKLEQHPEYGIWLKWFRNKLRELLNLQNYTK
jgi:hypothetical protein